MSLVSILLVILVVYLVIALFGALPAPDFQGRNPLFVVLVVILLVVLLRGPLGLHW